MPHTETSRHDRYTIQLYCQHCGTYLTTQVGIERERVASLRAQLREMAQQHANEIGREVEITFNITQQRRVWFTPDSAAQSSRPSPRVNATRGQALQRLRHLLRRESFGWRFGKGQALAHRVEVALQLSDPI